MVVKQRTIHQGYKMTELGEIPEGWEVKELIELSEGKGQYGIGASAIDYSLEKPRYLRITDIDEYGRLSMNDVKGFDAEKYETYILSEGDILFARTGNTTGKSYLYRKSDGDLVFAGFLIKFSINKKIADVEYIFHYVQTKKYWDWVKKMSARSGQPGINSNQYANLLIPYPPLKEQQKIAEILSAVDEQIDNTDQLINKTKELKKGLMQQLLTKGIGHSEFKKTELGEIPVGWEVKPLNEIARKITIGLVTTMTKYYVENGVPLIRNSDIKENKFLKNQMVSLEKGFAEKHSQKRFELGDVITVHTGDIGKSAVIENDLVGAQGFATLNTTPDPEIIDSYYLSWFFNSSVSLNQVYNFSTGDGRNNLNLKDFINLKIIVPNSLVEQHKIVKILSTVDEQIENYEQEKEKYMEFKKGLMQQLLTGKIRVTV